MFSATYTKMRIFLLQKTWLVMYLHYGLERYNIFLNSNIPYPKSTVCFSLLVSVSGKVKIFVSKNMITILIKEFKWYVRFLFPKKNLINIFKIIIPLLIFHIPNNFHYYFILVYLWSRLRESINYISIQQVQDRAGLIERGVEVACVRAEKEYNDIRIYKK